MYRSESKCHVFTEEKLSEIGAGLEHSSNSIRHLAQGTRVSYIKLTRFPEKDFYA
jgi:hypothetical protein